MSKNIEHAISGPNKKDETKHSLIISMSKDIGRGYSDLKKAIAGGGNSNKHPAEKKKEFIIKEQLTHHAQKRENSRKERRLAKKD